MTRLVVLLSVLAIAGAGAGYALFAFVLGGTPKIAVMNGPLVVVDFDEGVITFELANAILTKLDFAAADPDIKALVVRINSPGGEATSSERLYAAMADVRREMPVVVSAQWLLASGGYMMAMGANHIFADSGSNIGSIGVVSFVAPRGFPSEFRIGTGPSKVVGPSERVLFEELEVLKEAFYALVASERGALIELEKGDLLSGRTWLGVQAVQLGLIDELGGERDAIRKAAELAGLRRYEVVQLEDEMTEAGGLYAEAVETANAYDPELDFLFELEAAANPLALAGIGLGDATGSADRRLVGIKERALEVSRGPEPHLYHLYLPP
ncbi:MAG: S49 family peptidase [Chloroflexi bacterium]|nr:S49 family peptidase [Chloroflexota bacterium]